MPQWSNRAERLKQQPTSLFGEILDWLLAPLLFLWPISIVFTYNIVGNIADGPYDMHLADSVRVLADLVEVSDDDVVVDFPAPPRLLFRSDRDDTLFYQVATETGGVVAGDSEISWIHSDGVIDHDVRFRDDLIRGEEVRVAYLFVPVPESSPVVLVQLAETRHKRAELASSMLGGVLIPQLTIITLSIVLVWIGLMQGISPLKRLREKILRRRPTDMSPVPPSSVPDEVQPLIVAYNDIMSRLAENQKAQQRFIADAAHQMRTPMTGLKMQAELAQAETDPRQLRKTVAHISRSVDRTSHMINQLLSLARAESGDERLYAMETLNLNDIVRDAVELLLPRALEKRIDFGAEVPSGPVLIEGNAMLLQEMLKNLLDNAIKYTPPDGHVTIRVASDEEFTFCEVEDDGIGIPEADRQHVFERFYRVLNNDEAGSGLGLPIVREVAELHQASVTLEANPAGKGTVVRIVFTLT